LATLNPLCSKQAFVYTAQTCRV